MRINRYDFEEIQNIIDAAFSLQRAGKSKDCEKILTDLANEILRASHDENP